MPTKRVGRCLACGGDIIETTTTEPDWHASYQASMRCEMTTTLEHTDPMDAACRLVLETLRDEIQATLKRSMEHIAESFDIRRIL